MKPVQTDISCSSIYSRNTNFAMMKVLGLSIWNSLSLSSQVSVGSWSSESYRDVCSCVCICVCLWLMTCRCCVICCFKWLLRRVSSADWPIDDSFWLLKEQRQLSLCGFRPLLFPSMNAQLLSCCVVERLIEKVFGSCECKWQRQADVVSAVICGYVLWAAWGCNFETCYYLYILVNITRMIV